MSAESWAIIDGSTGKFMFGKQENLKREIASLTKIMTCYVCLQLIKEFYNENIENELVIISRFASV